MTTQTNEEALMAETETQAETETTGKRRRHGAGNKGLGLSPQKARTLARARVFTTGLVAELCNVAPRTVGKWFDSGRLKGYRLAGSLDRRIPREHLVAFMKENNMPLGPLAAQVECGATVYMAGCPEVLAESVGSSGAAIVRQANNIFDLGRLCQTLPPDLVVLDATLGTSACHAVAATIRQLRHDALIVFIAGDDGAPPDAASVYDLVMLQSDSLTQITTAVLSLLGIGGAA